MSSTKRIWVTGASEGIGLGLLQHYQRLGWQTVGSSRRTHGPAEADHWIPADLSDSAQRTKAVEQLTQDLGWPDLVVLNAGVGHWAKASETERSDAQRVLELNYWAPVELTRMLAERAQGRALHVVDRKSTRLNSSH